MVLAAPIAKKRAAKASRLQRRVLKNLRCILSAFELHSDSLYSVPFKYEQWVQGVPECAGSNKPMPQGVSSCCPPSEDDACQCTTKPFCRPHISGSLRAAKKRTNCSRFHISSVDTFCKFCQQSSDVRKSSRSFVFCWFFYVTFIPSGFDCELTRRRGSMIRLGSAPMRSRK